MMRDGIKRGEVCRVSKNTKIGAVVYAPARQQVATNTREFYFLLWDDESSGEGVNILVFPQLQLELPTRGGLSGFQSEACPPEQILGGLGREAGLLVGVTSSRRLFA